MKKKLKLLPVLLLAVVFITGTAGCGKKEKEEKKEDKPAQEVVQNREATERTRGWFVQAASKYTQETLGTEDCKLYAKVYDARDGITADNALLYASADISLYLDSKTVNEDKAAEFSDTFAKKLAADGAAGDIRFSVYTIPENIYKQIEEGNHTQVEEKASGTDGYSKYGFDYKGIGNAVASEGNGEWEEVLDGTGEDHNMVNPDGTNADIPSGENGSTEGDNADGAVPAVPEPDGTAAADDKSDGENQTGETSGSDTDTADSDTAATPPEENEDTESEGGGLHFEE